MALQARNGVDFNSQRGVNLASPSTGTDAANKSYVDNLTAGLEWKNAVRAATTTNGTLATAYANGSVIDGVTLATNDRILLKNQTTQTDNGIYTVNASGAPTRAGDADATAELNNATVFVTSGGQTDTAWTQTTAAPVIGTSNIVFVQFGAGTTYTAGNGLQGTSTFSVKADGSSIDVSSSGIKLAAAAAGTGIAVSGTGVISLAATPLAKYASTLTSGSSSYGPLTHGLGSADLIVMVLNSSTGQQEFPDVTVTSTTITIAFGAATAVNYRVVAIG